MTARIKNDRAVVYANVGVHADVRITLDLGGEDTPGAAIHFGHPGPDVIMEFADAESLEQLAAVAADGARQLRARAACPP